MNDLAARRARLPQIIDGEEIPPAPTPREFLDGPAIAVLLARIGVPVSLDTIRKWAERKKIERHGYDDRGRVLYEVREVSQVAHRHRRRRSA